MTSNNTTNSDFNSNARLLEISMRRFSKNDTFLETDTNNITNIIDLEDFNDLILSFNEMTNLGVALFDSSNQLLSSAGWQKICTKFHQKHPDAEKSCSDTEKFFSKNFEPNVAISHKCKNGLWDVAYPFFVDNEYLGNIQFGQFFYSSEEIDKAFFINQANKFNFDKDAYIKHLKNVPILSEEQVNSYVKFFLTVIEKIARIGKL